MDARVTKSWKSPVRSVAPASEEHFHLAILNRETEPATSVRLRAPHPEGGDFNYMKDMVPEWYSRNEFYDVTARVPREADATVDSAHVLRRPSCSPPPSARFCHCPLGSALGEDLASPLELLVVDLAVGEALLQQLQRRPLLGVLVATSPEAPS